MKIMCMGDSITYGTGLMDLSMRWSDIVESRSGHTLINLGIGGDTTGGMLARCQTQVFQNSPDALLILGGTNDICFTYDYHQALANIVSMIRQAQTLNIAVLIGIPIPFVWERFPYQEWVSDRDNEYVTEQCAKLAHALRAFCTAREIPYIDFRKAFFAEDGTIRADLFTDSLHPNRYGHLAMANVLSQRLTEIFPLESCLGVEPIDHR